MPQSKERLRDLAVGVPLAEPECTLLIEKDSFTGNTVGQKKRKRNDNNTKTACI